VQNVVECSFQPHDRVGRTSDARNRLERRFESFALVAPCMCIGSVRTWRVPDERHNKVLLIWTIATKCYYDFTI